jgi:hypothetical protein
MEHALDKIYHGFERTREEAQRDNEIFKFGRKIDEAICDLFTVVPSIFTGKDNPPGFLLPLCEFVDDIHGNVDKCINPTNIAVVAELMHERADILAKRHYFRSSEEVLQRQSNWCHKFIGKDSTAGAQADAEIEALKLRQASESR